MARAALVAILALSMTGKARALSRDVIIVKEGHAISKYVYVDGQLNWERVFRPSAKMLAAERAQELEAAAQARALRAWRMGARAGGRQRVAPAPAGAALPDVAASGAVARPLVRIPVPPEDPPELSHVVQMIQWLRRKERAQGRTALVPGSAAAGGGASAGGRGGADGGGGWPGSIEPRLPGPGRGEPIDWVSHQLRGVASYYGGGDPFTGCHTATGEILDDRALTAAHRALPLGSRVRVTSDVTGRSVVVRINDRGPFFSRRVIDLSVAAASAIGLVGDAHGLAPVRLEVLYSPSR